MIHIINVNLNDYAAEEAPLTDILCMARSTQCAKPLVALGLKFRTIEANYTTIRDGVIENVIENHLRETLL